MKKKALKKAIVKLDLEKIEIDSLSDSMLNGIQGGYLTQGLDSSTVCPSTGPSHCSCFGPAGCSWTNCWQTGCP